MDQQTPRRHQAAEAANPDLDGIEALLTFIVPQDTKPYFNSSALTGGLPEVFFESEEREVTIRDMRPLASGLSIDRHGFELHRHKTKVEDLFDDEQVGAIYDSEIEALLKEVTGADSVVVFDRTRRSDAPEGAANRDGTRGPATRVHVDYTVKSGPVRARDALGVEEVGRLLDSGGRIVQINVWRPISALVQRSPLALADALSVRMEELVATDQIFPHRIGEIYQLAHAPEQRWYWAPSMKREEVLLIKGWDSLDDGRARFTPHAAFQHPGQISTTPPRESIEVRTYLIFEGCGHLKAAPPTPSPHPKSPRRLSSGERRGIRHTVLSPRAIGKSWRKSAPPLPAPRFSGVSWFDGRRAQSCPDFPWRAGLSVRRDR